MTFGLSFPKPLVTPLRGSSSHGFGHVDVLRFDQTDSHLNGNKVYKLAGHLEVFLTSQRTSLLSFGGAYSNHLYALAALGQRLSIPTMGMVRGYAELPLTPTLSDCMQMGMSLHFLNKREYLNRYNLGYQQQLAAEHDAYVIPEGGAGAQGELGCRAIAEYCRDYQQVWLAVGTGTTALGLAAGLAEQPSPARLVGVQVVNDAGVCRDNWLSQMPDSIHWQLLDQYTDGGFGRCSERLIEKIHQYDNINLPLDPVYTVKLINAFECEYQRHPEWQQERILLIHTGGLQGRRGYSALNPLDQSEV